MDQGKMKLSKSQESVLRFLYEHKDDEDISTARIVAGTGLRPDEVVQALATLQEAGMVGGPPSLLKRTMDALKEMDDNLAPTDAGYAEHIVLLASAIEKGDETFLAAELGYDKDFVATVGSRLRSAGIWTADGLSDASLQRWKTENGGMAFWCDGAVATGSLKVAGTTQDGKPQYQMTERGMSDAAKLIKKSRR